MIILGINAYHGDSSACIIVDGKLIVAVEEERFRRIKHWAGLPIEAIRFCMNEIGKDISDVDHIAINRNPKANILKKALFALSKRPNFASIKDRLTNSSKISDLRGLIAEGLGVKSLNIRAKIHHVEHHVAHMASSFLVSSFDSAALVSVDGFGDFVSTMWGVGQSTAITVKDQVNFPHSLGLFYLAMTQYLGFPNYGDEYKVMGLAPYGKVNEMAKMRQIISLKPKGLFELNLQCFQHHSKGVSMVWANGEPTIEAVYAKGLTDILGPARLKDEPLTQYHKDLAASLQAMYEEAFFHLLSYVYTQTKSPNLCLAGGCAMNSVANGKIFDNSQFSDVYIQSAAGDAGGAIGAAFYVWHQQLKQPRSFVMDHSYWGPKFDDEVINELLITKKDELNDVDFIVEYIADETILCQKVAKKIGEGLVIGWFQGRMEWGPRALGNRSILGDPRRTDMKDILNIKIKRRESFRPFAPSILREDVGDWFETDYDVPFMLQVYQVLEKKRELIPAVTHVNGSGRLQTVTQVQNPLYYLLIKTFKEMTNVPMLLNTSFNENEPIVCRPQEALDCFLRTKMDILVMGHWVIERKN